MPRAARVDDVDMRILAVAAADVDGVPLDDLADDVGVVLADLRPRVVHLRRLGLVEAAAVRLTQRGRALELHKQLGWRLSSVVGEHQVSAVVALHGPCSVDELARRVAAEGWPAAADAHGRAAGAVRRAVDLAIESGRLSGPNTVLVSQRGLEWVRADPAADTLRATQARSWAQRSAAVRAWMSRQPRRGKQ